MGHLKREKEEEEINLLARQTSKEKQFFALNLYVRAWCKKHTAIPVAFFFITIS